MKVLVTGSKGFIGYHLCKRLLSNGHEVVGVDEINDYYDKSLKMQRTIRHEKYKEVVASIEQLQLEFFKSERFDVVVNLGGQAGVRYSIEKPYEYVRCNLNGFGNILELSRLSNVKHILYASSSSVYGDNSKIPYNEDDKIEGLKSFYAVTKYTNELMAKSYTDVYGIKTSGMRFFTVYGEWGRPDMMYFKMADAMRNGTKIQVHNGDMYRDFTYIDDIVSGIESIILDDSNVKDAQIYNIGNGNMVSLKDFVSAFEKAWGKELDKEYIEPTKVDVKRTFADNSKMKNKFGWKPKVDIEEGLNKFVKWYKEFYGIDE